MSSADLVLEIGPGIGVLTHELVQQAGWVIAVEVDKKLAEALEETLVPHQNFTILNQDVLEIEPRGSDRTGKSQLCLRRYRTRQNINWWPICPTTSPSPSSAISAKPN